MLTSPSKSVVALSYASTKQPRNSKAQVTATTSYPSTIPTVTQPTTTGQTVIVYGETADDPSLLKVCPFHFANNATDLGVRVVGWTAYQQSTGVVLWVPTILAELTPAYNSTVGSIPLFANFDGTASTAYFFSAITAAGSTPTVNVYSPGAASAANTPAAHALIDTAGSQIVGLQFKSSAGTMGAFWYSL